MKRFLLAICLLATTLVQYSCNKNNEDIGYRPSTKTLEVFKQQYPAATGVSWSEKGIYSVAKFVTNQKVTIKAWYNPSDKWAMSENTITFDMLPSGVKSTLAELKYIRGNVRNCYKLEHVNAALQYKIEVVLAVNSSSQEHEVFCLEDGTLIKDVIDDMPGDNFNENVPFIISDYVKATISENYPDAKIIIQTKDKTDIQVEIFDDKQLKLLSFKSNDNNISWIDTFWQPTKESIPTEIKDALVSMGLVLDNIYRVEASDKPSQRMTIYKLVFDTIDGVSYPVYTFYKDGTIIPM